MQSKDLFRKEDFLVDGKIYAWGHEPGNERNPDPFIFATNWDPFHPLEDQGISRVSENQHLVNDDGQWLGYYEYRGHYGNLRPMLREDYFKLITRLVNSVEDITTFLEDLEDNHLRGHIYTVHGPVPKAGIDQLYGVIYIPTMPRFSDEVGFVWERLCIEGLYHTLS